MLKCRLDVSDEALFSSVSAVLGLCGIDCSREEGGILVTDLPDADILPYSGCVMLTRAVNMTQESPAVRVVSLPLAYDELIEAVRSFESAEPADRGEKSPSGAGERTEPECSIVICEGCVSYGDKSVQLTVREAMLFELMASRPGEIVTREEIMSCIWSENDGTTNVADVYISYLRKKLIPLFGRGAVITVRGQGYMFVQPQNR
ncbi:MAG: winged-helix domain-containing protein [Clostridia bacterium]|nr:winged-helix domain-containing protein [Clostridia bacterium]